MKASLTWSKVWSSNLSNIYSDGKPIGSLDESFSKSVKGTFNGKEYIFKTHGFFKNNADIIDSSEDKVIGSIEFGNWMTKARITVNGKTINWKYDNISSTKWSISDSNGVIMSFSGFGSKGQIDTELDDGLLVLTGLFVTNYYWQITLFILLFAVFIPIILF